MTEKSMLFYQNVVPIERVKHKDLSIKKGVNYAFAEETATIPLVGIEFLRASSDYPIVFIGEGDNLFPAAIAGVQQGQNLFIDENKNWIAEYVPAFIRRYPFIYSVNDEETQFTLCIDENFEGCNYDGEGDRLFLEDGEQSEYLKSVLNFMDDYQQQYKMTQLLCRFLRENELLEPMSAKYKTPDGKERGISGFQTINREKFKALPEEKILEFFKNDALELIYHHFHSMKNFQPLIQKAAQSAPSAEEATAPA